MKVFSKQKLYQQIAFDAHGPEIDFWANECDGKPVIDGKCCGYCMRDEWCIDVPDAVEETGRILYKYLPNGFPKPEPKSEPKPNPSPDYQIIINCWDDTTHAEMFVNGIRVKETKAKRNPADKFNWRIGAQTAFNRLWEKKKKPVKEMSKYQKIFNDEMAKFVKLEADRIFRKFDRLPPVVREVRRRAMPGEWVKVIEATNDSANDYKYDKEYVVLEGYKPE